MKMIRRISCVRQNVSKKFKIAFVEHINKVKIRSRLILSRKTLYRSFCRAE